MQLADNRDQRANSGRILVRHSSDFYPTMKRLACIVKDNSKTVDKT